MPELTATLEVTAAVEMAIYQIDPGQSEARFSIGEMLFGQPNPVVGATSQVSGSISLTMDDLSQTKLSAIEIDARDLRTDEEMRNRAVRTFILQSSNDAHQFITFEPTAIEGLPAQANVGDAISFKVTGNLKIRDIVKPVTFDVTATATSESEIEGLARTTITRSDYELTIPNVPGVADVTDEVGLEFAFVATKQ